MAKQPIRITAPFDESVARSLKAGDSVLISGTIIAARDAAHKLMVEALDAGQPLPVDLKNQVVYYVGPSPAKPGEPIGSAGPTTSGRMDSYTPRLIEQGLRGMIGKGNRSQAVIDAMKKHGVVYFAAVGGAGALLSKSIREAEVVAYEDLGTEAIRKLTVEEFPVIVCMDSEGTDLYETAAEKYREEFV